jgi:succinoglycan biosynthesis transport protein ExoP
MEEQQFDLKRYLSLVYTRRYLVALTAAVIMTLAVALAYLLPRVYEARTLVSIDKNFLADILSRIAVTPTIEDKVRALSTVMKSRTLFLKVIGDLDVDLSRMSEAQIEKYFQDLQEKTDIRVEVSKTSQRKDVEFFILSNKDHNPKFARDFVNALVRRYIEESLGSRRDQTFGANRFLSDQISMFRERVDKLEGELIRLMADPSLQNYERLLELQKKMDVLLGQYTQDHPEVIRLRAEIETVRSQLPAGTTGSRSTQIASLDGKKKRIGDIVRERDTYKKIYEEFVTTYGKSEVSSQVEVQDKAATFRIIDPAVLPTIPVSPNRVLILLLGIVVGIAGGFGIVFLLDYLDPSVKSVDVLKSLGVTILAVIPHIDVVNVKEIVWRRRKDILLYGVSGLYVLAVAALAVREFLKTLTIR